MTSQQEKKREKKPIGKDMRDSWSIEVSLPRHVTRPFLVVVILLLGFSPIEELFIIILVSSSSSFCHFSLGTCRMPVIRLCCFIPSDVSHRRAGWKRRRRRRCMTRAPDR